MKRQLYDQAETSANRHRMQLIFIIRGTSGTEFMCAQQTSRGQRMGTTDVKKSLLQNYAFLYSESFSPDQ